MENNRKSMRGFASMDKARQRDIASKGGRAAHERGTAHEFDSLEATSAARKGHERGTAHEFTREEARIAGKKGGMARAANQEMAGAPMNRTEPEGTAGEPIAAVNPPETSGA